MVSTVLWESTPTTFEDEMPNCIFSVTTKVPSARIDTAERESALRRLPAPCRQQANALRLIRTELQEHQSTQCDLRDLQQAQNSDVHLIALKKLMKEKSLEDAVFPDDLQISQIGTITRSKTCCS